MTQLSPPAPLRPELGAFIGMIRRQLRLVLSVAGLVVGAAVLALVLIQPRFTATALVLVDPGQKNLLSPQSGLPAQSASENARVESEVAILRSDRVALSTVKAADLLSDTEFGPRPGTRDRLLALLGLAPAPRLQGTDLLEGTLKRLRKAVTVRRDGLTYLVRVSVTARDAARAARLANTLSRTYIDLQIQAKTDNFLAARDLLRGQIDAARSRLAKSEDALDIFIQSNLESLVSDMPAADISDGGLRDLAVSLRELNASRLRTQSLATLTEGAIATRDWEALASSLADEAMTALVTRSRALRQDLDGAPEQAPRVDLRARIARIEDRLNQRAETLSDSLQADLDRLNSRARGVRGQIRQQVVRGDLSSDALSRIYALRQESDIAQRHYGTLLTRLRDLEAQAVLQVADSRIVSDALPPVDPSHPRVWLLLAIALVAATGLGVGAGGLREHAMGGITTAEQLRALLPGAPVVAIPHTDAPSSPDPGPNGRGITEPIPAYATGPETPHGLVRGLADLVLDAPLSGFSEALRRLRAAVERGHDRSSPQGSSAGAMVIMVGSSLPDEGKTTLALALARTCKAAGRRTLLIDADMRRPGIHTMLGLRPALGLRDHLEGGAEGPHTGTGAAGGADHPVPGSAFVEDPRSGLLVLPAGSSDGHPADRAVQSDRFATLIAHVRGSVDVVIIDTPPLGPVVDGLYVAALADVVVHCVRYATTPHASVMDVRRQIEDAAPGVPLVMALTHSQDRQTPAGPGYFTDAHGVPLG